MWTVGRQTNVCWTDGGLRCSCGCGVAILWCIYPQQESSTAALCDGKWWCQGRAFCCLLKGRGPEAWLSPFSSVTKGQQYFSRCFFELQALWLPPSGPRVSFASVYQSCCWAGMWCWAGTWCWPFLALQKPSVRKHVANLFSALQS